jgi:nucleoside-diphosphate-sugar epimerase
LTVVVTGSSGFIGSHLCSALLAGGEQVLGIDRAPTSLVPTIRTDLAAPSEEALDALVDADVVWHLAACPGIRDRRPDIESRRRRDNVEAAARVLRAVPLRTPLIVTSSSSVYGGSFHRGIERASREDDPLRPRGGYARSKAAMEALCRSRAARGGRVSIARPFTVAGEHQRPDMAIASWIEAIRSGEVVSLLGSPDRTRDVTDVHDVVQGLLTMAEREVSGVVNLGSGAAYTLAEIVRAVSEALGVPAMVEVAPAPRDEVSATRADTTRCRKLLGITLETDLCALVKRQVEAAKADVLPGLQEVG